MKILSPQNELWFDLDEEFAITGNDELLLASTLVWDRNAWNQRLAWPNTDFQDVRASIQWWKDPLEGYIATVRIDGVARMQCDRCLGPVELPIHQTSDVWLVHNGHSNQSDQPWAQERELETDQLAQLVVSNEGINIMEILASSVNDGIPEYPRCDAQTIAQGKCVIPERNDDQQLPTALGKALFAAGIDQSNLN